MDIYVLNFYIKATTCSNFILFLINLNKMRTFSFTGKKSELSVDYYPPIYLDNNYVHVMGLINFETFNTIPNVDVENNTFKVGSEVIKIPVGAYEITDIEEYLQKKISELNLSKPNFNCSLVLHGNTNTLECEIKCTHEIDFTVPNSIGSLLGFGNKKLAANKTNISSEPVNILKINAIKILCNITSGSYDNGQASHIIHEFFPAVPPGFKIIETPQNVIYLPINTNVITNITLKIVDQDGNLINFRGETVTIRLHLKSLEWL